MKKLVLFPALATACSVASAVIFRRPATYFNLFLSIVLLGLVLFSPQRSAVSRIRLSALWLFILELAAFLPLLFGVDLYQSSLIWLMYAVFIILEVFITPRLDKER